MTARMTSAITGMIVLCLFSVLGGLSMAMEEPPSSASHAQHLNSVIGGLNLDEPSEKRAYTYVSEYKRLPVYNFGLGKRWVDSNEDKRARPYSFGLGKRTRQYSFGLGKRNDDQEYYPGRMEYLPLESYEGYHSRDDGLDELSEDKRSNRLYSFGLGKRGWNLAAVGAAEPMGTGKRPSDVISQRYLFGLGKRMLEEDEAAQ